MHLQWSQVSITEEMKEDVVFKVKITKILMIAFLIGIFIGLSKNTVNESKAQVKIVHEEVEIEYLNGEEKWAWTGIY